ncbi:MAG: glycosyltransferase [Acidobacteriota bacterium]|nr:glycosyltransferase [Acidobacteriota bacterium]
MNRALVIVVLIVVGVVVLSIKIGGALPAAPAGGFDVLVYIAVNLIVFIDLIDVAIRFLLMKKNNALNATSVPLRVGEFSPYQMKLHLRPYALILSVHNAEDELEAFLEGIESYREHLWVIDDASTDRTFLRLRQAGVHCIRGEVNRKKPAALKELLKQLPPEITTIGVLDPDGIIQNRSQTEISDLERSIFEFQRSGFAAFCPRIRVRQDGWLARLQELEYAFTFEIGRKSLADRSITSGIAFYRRDALERVFERHQLSVYAEDLRNALLLLGDGQQIYYDDRLEIQVEGKRTIDAWFSQRVGWFFGLMKVYYENFAEVQKTAGNRLFFTYHYLVYMGIFAIIFHPLKLIALILSIAGVVNAIDDLLGIHAIANGAWNDPFYFLLAYAKYTLLTIFLLVVSAKGERLRLLVAVPVYYLYQLLHIIPVTTGYLNWFSLRFFGRRVYQDHFQDEVSLAREFREQFGA